MIAAQKTDDPEILAQLARDNELDVRKAVVKNTDDPEILALLVDDKNWWIREEVERKLGIADQFEDDEDSDVVSARNLTGRYLCIL